MGIYRRKILIGKITEIVKWMSVDELEVLYINLKKD